MHINMLHIRTHWIQRTTEAQAFYAEYKYMYMTTFHTALVKYFIPTYGSINFGFSWHMVVTNTLMQQSNKLVIILNRLQYAIVWACAAKRWWLGEEMHRAWSRGPQTKRKTKEDLERGCGKGLSTVKHSNWRRRMLQIIVNRGSW